MLRPTQLPSLTPANTVILTTAQYDALESGAIARMPMGMVVVIVEAGGGGAVVAVRYRTEAGLVLAPIPQSSVNVQSLAPGASTIPYDFDVGAGGDQTTILVNFAPRGMSVLSATVMVNVADPGAVAELQNVTPMSPTVLAGPFDVGSLGLKFPDNLYQSADMSITKSDQIALYRSSTDVVCRVTFLCNIIE